jgi:GMP synthase (glutamine-hydrolysing)
MSAPRPVAQSSQVLSPSAGGASGAAAAPVASPSPDIHADRVLIIDFGAQYTQLIARRVRELGVYCEIRPWDMPDRDVAAFAPRGIILSGGPESVTDAVPPRAPASVFTLGVPVLGICYGMQTMAQQLGGRVATSSHREFGYAEVQQSGACRLFADLAERHQADGTQVFDVWMSHGDKVESVPPGFRVVGASPNAPIAAMADESRHFYAVQFHPEVTHTRQGAAMLERFVREICGCAALWTAGSIIDDAIARVAVRRRRFFRRCRAAAPSHWRPARLRVRRPWPAAPQ